MHFPAAEIGQWVRALAEQVWSPALDPEHQHTWQALPPAPAPAVLGVGGTEIPGTCWPASLAKTSEHRFSERHCLT